MATTYASSGPEVSGYGGGEGITLGNSSSDLIGFYGTAPIAKATLAQLATTATTTQLRAELSALQNALANLGLITVT
jgi:hypothetical protein